MLCDHLLLTPKGKNTISNPKELETLLGCCAQNPTQESPR